MMLGLKARRNLLGSTDLFNEFAIPWTTSITDTNAIERKVSPPKTCQAHTNRLQNISANRIHTHKSKRAEPFPL